MSKQENTQGVEHKQTDSIPLSKHPIFTTVAHGVHIAVESAQEHAASVISSAGLGKLERGISNTYLGIPSDAFNLAQNISDAEHAGDPHSFRTGSLTTVIDKIIPGPSAITTAIINASDNLGSYMDKILEQGIKDPQIAKALEQNDIRTLESIGDIKAVSTLFRFPGIVTQKSGNVLTAWGENIDQKRKQTNQIPTIQRIRAADPDFNEEQALLDGIGPTLKFAGSMLKNGISTTIVPEINNVLNYQEPLPKPEKSPEHPQIPVSSLISQPSSSLSGVPSVQDKKEKSGHSTAVNTHVNPLEVKKLSSITQLPIHQISSSAFEPPLSIFSTRNHSNNIPGKIEISEEKFEISVTVPPPFDIIVAAGYVGYQGIQEIQRYLKNKRDQNYVERVSQARQQVSASSLPMPSLAVLPPEIKAGIEQQLQEEQYWRNKEIDALAEVRLRNKHIDNCEDRLSRWYLFWMHNTDENSRNDGISDKEKYLQDVARAVKNRQQAICKAEEILKQHIERQETYTKEKEQKISISTKSCHSLNITPQVPSVVSSIPVTTPSTSASLPQLNFSLSQSNFPLLRPQGLSTLVNRHISRTSAGIRPVGQSSVSTVGRTSFPTLASSPGTSSASLFLERNRQRMKRERELNPQKLLHGESTLSQRPGKLVKF